MNTNIKLLLFFMLLCSQNTHASKLAKESRFIISYWNEIAVKPGVLLGADWEFRNKEGHGVAVTFPNVVVFVFPNNYVSLSLYTTLSYRFVNPKNGFYTGLTLGVGMNTQWKTVPLYNMDGLLIQDTGFTRAIGIAQWDLGYDFEVVYKSPVRMFFSMGWNGVAPNNLGVHSGIMLQLGLSIKLANLIKARENGDV